jgi:hypothetical protein
MELDNDHLFTAVCWRHGKVGAGATACLVARLDGGPHADIRATMKIPAVTMVAAWISAEIGVGPSIESGNQTCSGTCADFPMAPTNSSKQMIVIQLHWLPKMPVIVSVACWGALANTAA